MIANAELQELYRLLADVLDGFNRTHDVQVAYVDFSAFVPDEDAHNGSLVCREYEQSIIDYHYRDLGPDDFDWFGPDDWVYVDRSREVERILAERRKTAQRYHREGRDLRTLWYVRDRERRRTEDIELSWERENAARWR